MGNEYWLESIALAIFTMALLLVPWLFARLIKPKFSDPILGDLVQFFIAVKLVLYYALPTILRILSNYQYEFEDRVAVFDLVRVYLIELISWLAWCFGVWLVANRGRTYSPDRGTLLARNFLESRTLLVLIAGFSIFSFIAGLPPFRVQMKEITGSFVFELFKGLALYAGLTVGPLLLFGGRKYFTKVHRAMGGLLTLLSVVLVESRGAMIYLLIYCGFLVLSVFENRRQFYTLLVVASAVLVLYLTFGGLFAGRLVTSSDGEVEIVLGVDTEKKGDRTAFEEIEWRFGAATRTGTAFLTMYERGDSAGYLPMLNSFLGFLPRSINPDKPIPSTLVGDDIYTQGMYLIWREIHGYNTFSMVEFPTGAHFYWEFGFVGVLILSIVSGCYIAACARWFSRLGIVSIALMVAVFKPWGYVDPKIWISDALLQVYQIILPFALLVLIVRLGAWVWRHTKSTLISLGSR